MVFSRLADIISVASSRTSVPKSPAAPYESPGLPALAGSVFSSSGQKNNNIRLSSSLQDFSAYRRLDPEEGILISENERSAINPKQNPSLGENGGATFSKEKSPPRIPVARRKWMQVILVFLCLLLFTFLLYTLQYFYFNWSQGASKYYVVLDCGSTGTRVYVYKASINRQKDDSLPISLKSVPEFLQNKPSSQSGRAYNRMETEPGFDKLVNNVSGLRGAIEPLIQWVEKQIPKHSHKTTSLFLYATAGVRRLPNPDSKWLLDNAWFILNNSSFLCQREWVKIITGTEEAYYGWIALNYHTGVLGAIPKKETYGALDLGGSSLQVTFESKDYVHNETTLKLSVGSVNHHLIAYSLAGYGLNDAFDKSVVHLLNKKHFSKADIIGGKSVLGHPCLQSGYKEQYICTQCASAFQDNGSPIGRKLLGKRGKPGIPIQLTGAPNWKECSALAKVAVNLSEWSDRSPDLDCELQPCSLSNDLPRPYGQFYAMSGFYVVYRFFNLTPDSALDDVLERGQEFCEKDWDVAKKSVAPQPFIEQYCFRAPYVVLLLREGLHITESRVAIGSGGITWTTGVALLEAGKALSPIVVLPYYEALRMKINPVILIAILFVSSCIVVCALSCIGDWMPRFFRGPYLPLFSHNSTSGASVLNIPTPFRFQRWSPIISGEGRVKMPLSPVANAQRRPFGSGIQLAESPSLYPSSSSVAHSYSSGSLGQMQFDDTITTSMGSFWSPRRNQMRLQSRRSQSREDLNSSLADLHMPNV